LSGESEIKEGKEVDLLELLDDIIAKGRLPPSARDEIRCNKIWPNSNGDLT
jgi:hypothetical protein